MLRLGVEKWPEGVGRGRAPGCSRSECDQQRRQPTQIEPQEDALLCARLHMLPLGAKEKRFCALP